MTPQPEPQPEATFAHRLAGATSAHDLDAVVACFTEDYLNATPVHPARSFRGRDQVRRNWTQIFASVPDITAEVLRSDRAGDTLWSEWELRGTRLDGSAHLMRGVMVFTLDGDQACAVRFYLEPVDDDGRDADQAVRELVGRPKP